MPQPKEAAGNVALANMASSVRGARIWWRSYYVSRGAWRSENDVRQKTKAAGELVILNRKRLWDLRAMAAQCYAVAAFMKGECRDCKGTKQGRDFMSLCPNEEKTCLVKVSKTTVK